MTKKRTRRSRTGQKSRKEGGNKKRRKKRRKGEREEDKKCGKKKWGAISSSQTGLHHELLSRPGLHSRTLLQKWSEKIK